MNANNCQISTCRNCQFFNPDGHLHGSCQQLHVIVDGDWQACSLGTPAFVAIAKERWFDRSLVQLALELHGSEAAAVSPRRSYASTTH